MQANYKRFEQAVLRITQLDHEEYRDLSAEFEALGSLEAKAEAVKELHALRKKFKFDAVLARLSSAIAANDAALRDALNRARAELKAGNIKRCLQALREGRRAEAEALRLASQSLRFSNSLKESAAKVLAKINLRGKESAPA